MALFKFSTFWCTLISYKPFAIGLLCCDGRITVTVLHIEVLQYKYSFILVYVTLVYCSCKLVPCIIYSRNIKSGYSLSRFQFVVQLILRQQNPLNHQHAEPNPLYLFIFWIYKCLLNDSLRIQGGGECLPSTSFGRSSDSFSPPPRPVKVPFESKY